MRMTRFSEPYNELHVQYPTDKENLSKFALQFFIETTNSLFRALQRSKLFLSYTVWMLIHFVSSTSDCCCLQNLPSLFDILNHLDSYTVLKNHNYLTKPTGPRVFISKTVESKLTHLKKFQLNNRPG